LSALDPNIHQKSHGQLSIKPNFKNYTLSTSSPMSHWHAWFNYFNSQAQTILDQSTSSQFYFIHLQVKPLKFTTTVQMSAKQCGSENPLLTTGLHCNVLSFTLKWDLNLKFQCTDIVHAPVTANKRRIIAYFLSWNCGPKESSPIRILKYVRHKPSQQANTVQNCKQQNTKIY